MNQETNQETNHIDEDLLAMLACPACDDRPPLRQEGAWLVCDSCHRRYPIEDGIPVVLVDSAVAPDDVTK